jgi:predicted membrane channel-forming protein YqfA (hemolysin III family)
MHPLLVLAAAVLFFIVAAWGISKIPPPPKSPEYLQLALYIILGVVSLWWLYTHYLA